MGSSEDDPGAQTSMFQAFVDRDDRPADFSPSRSRDPLALAIVGAAVVIALVALLLTG